MIPTTVHRLWTGPPMPDHLAGYVASWTEHHPSWTSRLWTDADDWSWLANYDLWQRAPELFPRNVGQFRADVARLELLHRDGGVWADTDMECLRPLDPLLAEAGDLFLAWEQEPLWVNNAVMGAVPGHPLLAELIDALPASVAARRPGDRPNRVSGPQFITPHVRAQPAGTVRVYPARMFYPYLWSELDRQGEHFPDAYTVHHWHNRRTNR